jgi:hypothetical protein
MQLAGTSTALSPCSKFRHGWCILLTLFISRSDRLRPGSLNGLSKFYTAYSLYNLIRAFRSLGPVIEKIDRHSDPVIFLPVAHDRDLCRFWSIAISYGTAIQVGCRSRVGFNPQPKEVIRATTCFQTSATAWVAVEIILFLFMC